MLIQDYLERAVGRYPDRPAVEEPDRTTVTYRQLWDLSEKVASLLSEVGVAKGDRVALSLHKSIDSVATILGILKAGATYVPLDPTGPPSRNAFILQDCAVRHFIVEETILKGIKSHLPKDIIPSLTIVDGVGGGKPLARAIGEPRARVIGAGKIDPGSLAYILYTSGSTGKPKGVCLSHRAAASFVDWCTELLSPNENDRFSSHAPFHFDLSILDLYVSIKHGASLVLIDEQTGKDPLSLARLMALSEISVWYSTPSILALMTQYGKLESYDYPSLRAVLFAGEVFPLKHLDRLKRLLPQPRYFNLYGPTETNVCTFFEVPERLPGKMRSLPIGRVCSHLKARVVDSEGNDVSQGTEGELCITGPGVMDGYWNRPEQTEQAFLTDAQGQQWYRTGDIVVEGPSGYEFLGRRDRMVKKRGYRIELGEIEAGLYQHPDVKEAAVIAANPEEGITLRAFLSFHGERRPSLIELKRFCVENLPAYMVPDLFSFQPTLPRTSTSKVDYQQLARLHQEEMVKR